LRERSWYIVGAAVALSTVAVSAVSMHLLGISIDNIPERFREVVTGGPAPLPEAPQGSPAESETPVESDMPDAMPAPPDFEPPPDPASRPPDQFPPNAPSAAPADARRAVPDPAPYAPIEINGLRLRATNSSDQAAAGGTFNIGEAVFVVSAPRTRRLTEIHADEYVLGPCNGPTLSSDAAARLVRRIEQEGGGCLRIWNSRLGQQRTTEAPSP